MQETPIRRAGPDRAAARGRFGSWLAVWGPGVLGLMADNDAGGMVAYLITGGNDHLAWYLGALGLLVPATYLVQSLALSVALGSRRPVGVLLRRRWGPWPAALNSLVLYALNTVILVTEFAGMARALRLWGVPVPAGLGAAWALVTFLSLWRPYREVERWLLGLSAGSLAFVAAFLLLLPPRQPWPVLAGGPLTLHTGFLLLALAGNSIAPWMLDWQQNAVLAGRIRTPAEGRADLRWGAAGQGLFAALAMAAGALLDVGAGGSAHPLSWVAAHAGPLVARLLTVGIAEAGLLAAVTVSLTSTWMLAQGIPLLGSGPDPGAPPRGRAAAIHLLTLAGAGLPVLVPGFALGPVAVWAQAAGALYLPVTILLYLALARDPAVMGPYRLSPARSRLLAAVACGFLALGMAALRA
ncbi:MAG: divalent metal cation transporter [Firmicutes bacterium]|nr:divalent metal cation transporter [Bacillota bacterium]